MRFRKHRRHADCNRRPRQHRRKLALSAGTAAHAARLLHRMRRIKNNRAARIRRHPRQPAHIRNQRIIAEARAALGQADIMVSRFVTLDHQIFRFPRRQKLPFLDIDNLARFRRSYDQIRLPAQKRRYLQHINMLRDNCALLFFMYVGNNRQIIVKLFNLVKSTHSFFQPDAARAVNGSAVRLVKRRLENIRDIKFFRYFDHCPRNVNRMLPALNLARPAQKPERQVVCQFHAVNVNNSLFHCNTFPKSSIWQNGMPFSRFRQTKNPAPRIFAHKKIPRLTSFAQKNPPLL